MIDDDKFFAWLDGELPADEARIMGAAVAADPALAARADAHRRLGDRLGAAFRPVMDAPVPDRIGAAPTDLSAFRKDREARRPAALPAWASIAATLVVGIAIGGMGIKQLSPATGGAPVAIDGDRMVAAAALDEALDVRLASASDGAGPRIGLTFRDPSGRVCRSFSGAAGASGLACRDGDDWAIEGLFKGAEGQGGDYRMAAGEDPALMAMIAGRIAGEPMDAAAEAKAKADGWR